MPASQRFPPHVRRDHFDPVPEFVEHCARTPLARMDLGTAGEPVEAWLATGYEEVRAVLADATRFRMLEPDRKDVTRRPIPGNLLQLNGAEHTRMRKMLLPEFTGRRLRRLEPRIADIVEEALDDLESAGQPGDLVRHFATPVPALVIGEMLGIPPDDLIELGRLVEIVDDSRRGRQEQQAAARELHAYAYRFLEEERKDPGEEMLGMLIREHGEELTDEELAGMAVFMLVPTINNVPSSLSLGTLALLRHPGQLAALREKPEMADHAVEEILRYVNAIMTATPRIATEDVELAGQTIRAGDRVVCSLMAANRDERVTSAPGEFDLTRGSVAHMALGHGSHHCPGAWLTRMTMRIAFTALLRRFPGLRLAIPYEEVPFHLPRHRAPYGVYRLPVAW